MSKTRIQISVYSAIITQPFLLITYLRFKQLGITAKHENMKAVTLSNRAPCDLSKHSPLKFNDISLNYLQDLCMGRSSPQAISTWTELIVVSTLRRFRWCWTFMIHIMARLWTAIVACAEQQFECNQHSKTRPPLVHRLAQRLG